MPCLPGLLLPLVVETFELIRRFGFGGRQFTLEHMEWQNGFIFKKASSKGNMDVSVSG